MSYRLEPHQPICDGTERIVCKQIGRVLRESPDVARRTNRRTKQYRKAWQRERNFLVAR